MRRIPLTGAALIVLNILFAPLGATAHEHTGRLATGVQMLATRDAYVRGCAACHGADGTGNTARVDFTSPDAVARMTRDGMIAKARGGHAPELVAHWDRDLGENGIARVVDYIREALMLPAPAADASVGRRVYARTCSVCHGERGNAASWAQNSLSPPPFDFTSGKGRGLSRQRMIHAVTYGVDGTAMMPFATQFGRDQIAAVVDYIRMTFMRSAQDDGNRPAERRHTAASQDRAASGHEHGGHIMDPEAPFPIGLVGDVVAGRIFYEKNCSQCHGMDGIGNGPRAYFMRRKPKDFTAPRARAEFDRPHLFEGIAKGVRGTDMPAWSKVLTLQEIADVAEYVFQAFANAEPQAATGSGPGPGSGSDHDHAPQATPGHHDKDAPVKKN